MVIGAFGWGISRYGYRDLFQAILNMIIFSIVFDCFSVMVTNVVIFAGVSHCGCGLLTTFNKVEW